MVSKGESLQTVYIRLFTEDLRSTWRVGGKSIEREKRPSIVGSH